MAQRRVEPCACAGKENVENAKLAHESDQGHDGDKQRVDGALCDHRAQCLGKGHAVVAPQYAAACYLADAGNDQAHGVGEEYRVEADRPAWPLAHRLQCLAPSPSPECLSQHPERQRQQHPSPVHLVEHHLSHAIEVEAAIHPVEYRPTQRERQHHFYRVVSKLL